MAFIRSSSALPRPNLRSRLHSSLAVPQICLEMNTKRSKNIKSHALLCVTEFRKYPVKLYWRSFFLRWSTDNFLYFTQLYLSIRIDLDISPNARMLCMPQRPINAGLQYMNSYSRKFTPVRNPVRRCLVCLQYARSIWIGQSCKPRFLKL